MISELESDPMVTSPHATTVKYFLAGVLISAGLAAQGAYARDLVFIETSTVVVAGSDWDQFSGSGPWAISAQEPFFEAAWSSGGPTGLSLGVGPVSFSSSASLHSHFTVTSDVVASVEWALENGGFVITDLTHDLVLLSSDTHGSKHIELFAGVDYEISAGMASGRILGSSMSLTIPAPASTALLGPIALLTSRRRRS